MTKNLQFIAVIAVLLVAITACSKEEGAEVIVPQPEQENSFRVSVGDALRSAEAILNSGDRATRSVERKVKSTEIYVAKPATRSNDDVEVSFYLINYEGNAGYALVSTDKRATPVYMYADEGNITTADLQKEGPMQILMDEAVANYEAEVASSGTDGPIDIFVPDTLDSARPIRIDGESYYINTDTTYVVKENLTNAWWHQEAPYNKYCNNKDVGCGPIAIGQIMAYHKYPASYSGSVINWDAITSAQEFEDETDYGADETADLLYRIGYCAGIRYFATNYESSSISNSDAVNVFRSFGYTCTNPANFSSYTVAYEIDYNRPVFVSGYIPDDPSGHAWVIDGYNKTVYTKKYYLATPPYPLSNTTTSEAITYLKQNVGSGLSFYLYNALAEYTEDVKIITNIKPNN